MPRWMKADMKELKLRPDASLFQEESDDCI